MNMREVADALFKIGEGFQDLSRSLGNTQVLNDPAALDVSGDTVEGRRRRQAIVLHAFEKGGDRLHRNDFYQVATSVGYDNRGLAGFSTSQADLVKVEMDERKVDTGYRVLTEKGRSRLNANRHLLPPE